MLTAFGLIGASAAGVVGSFDLLATTILTSNVTSVTFDTSTYAALGYKHLQIRMSAQETTTGFGSLNARFNSDTGSNYSYHSLSGDSSSVSAGDYSASTTSMLVSYMNRSNSSDAFTGIVWDLLDPFSTTKYKTNKGFGGTKNTNGTSYLGLFSSSWRSTSAVTSISISPGGFGGGTFGINSRFSIYGIKG